MQNRDRSQRKDGDAQLRENEGERSARGASGARIYPETQQNAPLDGSGRHTSAKTAATRDEGRAFRLSAARIILIGAVIAALAIFLPVFYYLLLT